MWGIEKIVSYFSQRYASGSEYNDPDLNANTNMALIFHPEPISIPPQQSTLSNIPFPFFSLSLSLLFHHCAVILLLLSRRRCHPSLTSSSMWTSFIFSLHLYSVFLDRILYLDSHQAINSISCQFTYKRNATSECLIIKQS